MSSSWSWTRLSTALDCSLAHNLKYIKRVKGKSNQSIYLVGRVTHAVIQAWAHAGYPDDLLQDAINKALKAEFALLRNLDHKTAMDYASRATAASFATAKIYHELQLPEHDAIIEERFSLPYTPEIRLTGAPDAYDPVTKTIVDLKTQKTGRAKPAQLYTYALAERLLGREVAQGVFVYPVQAIKQETYPITAEDVDRQAAILREVATHDGSIQATPGPHCFFCPYDGTRSCTVTFNRLRPAFRRENQPGGDSQVAEASGASLQIEDGSGDSTEGYAKPA